MSRPSSSPDPALDPVEQSRMPLRQHLEELRRCLLRSVLAFVVLFGASLAFADLLRDLVLVPWETMRAAQRAAGAHDPGTLIYIGPAESFLFSIKVGGAFALLVGGPFYLWQAWTFIAAGLHAHEKRAVYRSFPLATVLFAAGLVFGYLVLLPLGLRFLLSYADPEVLTPQITVSKYFSLLAVLSLLMGFVFELPLVMWVLVRTGLVELSTLAASRRVAIVAMLVFSSLMTPPDPVTQLLVAGPMVVLYELGLLFARRAARVPDLDA